MSKTKNVVIDDLNKEQTIKYLSELMATVQMAYFKGRLGERNGDDTGSDGAICGELWVHEGDDLHPAAISIDLYHFEGDGEDVCDGLHGVTPYHGEDTESETGWVFNMGYDPDDEYPLYFCFHPDDDGEDYTILPTTLPEDLLQRIAAWLEKAMTPAK